MFCLLFLTVQGQIFLLWNFIVISLLKGNLALIFFFFLEFWNTLPFWSFLRKSASSTITASLCFLTWSITLKFHVSVLQGHTHLHPYIQWSVTLFFVYFSASLSQFNSGKVRNLNFAMCTLSSFLLHGSSSSVRAAHHVRMLLLKWTARQLIQFELRFLHTNLSLVNQHNKVQWRPSQIKPSKEKMYFLQFLSLEQTQS